MNEEKKIAGLYTCINGRSGTRRIQFTRTRKAFNDYDELKKNYNKQRQKINKLNNQTKDLNTKSEEIKDIINNLKNENSILKEKNKTLQNELNNLKELFEKIKNKINNLYHFFVDKMWGNKEKRDKYYPVAYELYGKNILEEEQIRGILGTKNRFAEIDRDSKSKDDDFEL